MVIRLRETASRYYQDLDRFRGRYAGAVEGVQTLVKTGNLQVLGGGFFAIKRANFEWCEGKSCQTFENIQKRSKTV